MENVKFEVSPYWSKENKLLWVNVLILLLALYIIVKFWKVKEFWYGFATLFLMGMMFYAGPKPEPDPTEQSI